MNEMRILFRNVAGRIGTRTKGQPINDGIAFVPQTCDIVALTEIDHHKANREDVLNALASTYRDKPYGWSMVWIEAPYYWRAKGSSGALVTYVEGDLTGAMAASAE